MGDRFATLFECSLNFPSASYLDIQCMHGGRMSQCYINIIRNTFMRARVTRDDTFFLKIVHLAILIKPTPLLEKISSCGLQSRLWVLVVVNVHLINSNYFISILLK